MLDIYPLVTKLVVFYLIPFVFIWDILFQNDPSLKKDDVQSGCNKLNISH